MRYLLTALAVAVGVLALAAGGLSAAREIPQIKHATLHVEQVGNKFFLTERAEMIPRIKHATLHLEFRGPKFLTVERAEMLPQIKHATLHLEQRGNKFLLGS